jgi:hypothetical protein
MMAPRLVLMMAVLMMALLSHVSTVAALGRALADCQRVALMFHNNCPNSATDANGVVS